MNDINIVKASFQAFQRQDSEAAQQLLADDFTFTSRQDDHLDRAAFMQRCFPTAERFAQQRLLEIISTSHGVLSLYEYELKDGGRYRNVELSKVKNDLIVETQVFFGGAVG